MELTDDQKQVLEEIPGYVRVDTLKKWIFDMRDEEIANVGDPHIDEPTYNTRKGVRIAIEILEDDFDLGDD